ncbi:MAG: EAL domain-containing protein, partial [Oscillatoriales cyanobacterium SM2_1_8]|nr:EAL domain-containing protein [Oscillatoriales cyanobacterium SM2_1_8]
MLPVSILVVEDSKVLREEVGDILRLEGYEVWEAENGRVGLELAKLRRPDVILCDVAMPEMDGFSLLQALRQHHDTESIPLIFLTAQTEKRDIRRGMELGADDYLTKPFTASELLGAVQARLQKQARLAARRSPAMTSEPTSCDPVTGLPNAQALEFSLAAAIARAGVGLAVLDFGNFDALEGVMGSSLEPWLLPQIAQRLREGLPGSTLVARTREAEFALLVPNNPLDNLERIARTCLRLVATAFVLNGREVMLHCHVGLAAAPRDASHPGELLRCARLAVQAAREEGRNSICRFSAALQTQTIERVEFDGDLYRAIANNELVLHFQPIVRLATGRCESFEALVRWQHPSLGLLSPDRFIPAAESSGSILALTEWVLERAILCSRRSAIPIAVNLSSYDCQREGIVETVEKLLRDRHAEPQALQVEITESAIVKQLETTMDNLRRLRAMGIRVAIDDFGTGYSSLSYLKYLPVDKLKIDRSFVKDLEADSNDTAILPAIIEMARRLSLETIAEGVETQEQESFCKSTAAIVPRATCTA